MKLKEKQCWQISHKVTDKSLWNILLNKTKKLLMKLIEPCWVICAKIVESKLRKICETVESIYYSENSETYW